MGIFYRTATIKNRNYIDFLLEILKSNSISNIKGFTFDFIAGLNFKLKPDFEYIA